MSCTCNIDLVPLGSPRCTFDFNIIRGAIFFDASVVDDPANFSGNILNIQTLIADGLAVASPKFFDVTTDKEAAVTQSFADGTSFYIRDGIRTFTGIVAKPTPSQVGAFKALRCKKTAIYLVDNNGNILGYTNNTGVPNPMTDKLLPIPIEAGTVDAILAFANDAAIRQSNVTFQFSQIVKDEQYRGAIVSPDGYILNLIENPTIGLYGIDFTIDITVDALSFSLIAQNGSLIPTYLTDEDFVNTTITLSGKNITAGGNFSLVCNFITMNGNLIECSGLVPTNLTAGDEILVTKITNVKDPFRDLLISGTAVTTM